LHEYQVLILASYLSPIQERSALLFYRCNIDTVSTNVFSAWADIP
jgi:hypothetical protein